MKKVVLHVRIRIGAGTAAATSPYSILCQIPSRAATVDARCLAISTTSEPAADDGCPGAALLITLH